MRILYIDIDSLRPDHLGCYGYHRDTSPNIDAIADQGLRFNNFFVSDAPCLPSRTALFCGQFGIHNGVINHGGVAADLHHEGEGRAFRTLLNPYSWMGLLRRAGLKTATVSPFGERHSAWWWYAGFNEIYNTGLMGMESAEQCAPVAIDWIDRNGKADDWFLHVNLWDPHTAYRAPAEFGEPFKDQPLPDWLTEDVRRRHWDGCGPHSAREISGFAPSFREQFPRQPAEADSMDKVRMMFDGYDTGVRYADLWIGRIFDALRRQGVFEDTVVIISADHGENLGELNIYGDHQTADLVTTRVPLIVRWPGVTTPGSVNDGLHYHVDFAATLVELLGGQVPGHWDGVSFADAMRGQRHGPDSGRDYLVVSQGAWSCQRAVRFRDPGQKQAGGSGELMCIRSYHDGYHGYPEIMLFDVGRDPHEQHNLAVEQPHLVERAMGMLDDWHGQMMRRTSPAKASIPIDPMWTVMREGGAFHTRGQLPAYLQRLRDTGRSHWAEHLQARYPDEC